MYPSHATVLLATDRPDRVLSVRRSLDSSRGAIELLWGTFTLIETCSLHEARGILENGLIDLVLLDPSLGLREGMDPLNTILLASPRTAVVVMVSEEDDGGAWDVLRRGAQDYVMDSEFNSRALARTLRGAIERKLTEMEIAESRVELIWRLAKAAEYRDSETGNHVVRVGCFARELGIAMGVARNEVETLFLAAPLHDIGKLGIPDAILHKPGKLTPAEMLIMQQHCAIGARILDDEIDADQSPYTKRVVSSGCLGRHDDPVRVMAQQIAMSHHERWDGTGYPGRLRGDDIPLWGRIVSICDVFDALLSERPYKPAFELDMALSILREGNGTHFDPAVVRAFEDRLPSLLEIRHHLTDNASTETPVELALGALV